MQIAIAIENLAPKKEEIGMEGIKKTVYWVPVRAGV